MLTSSISVGVVQAGLPGMANFDLGPMTVPIDRTVRTLRIYLPGERVLKLRSVKLKPALAPDEQFTTRSSSLAKGGKSDALIAGKQIQTRKVAEPFWEATFATPRHIDALSIRGGKNFDITKLYTLRVEVDGALVYDNLSPAKCEAKIETFLARVQEYVEKATAARRGLGGPARKFQIAAVALAGQVRAALTDPDVDLTALNAARLQCIDTLVSSLKPVRGSEIKAVYTAAKPVLSSLVSRGQPKAGSASLTVETDAAAMLLSILLINSARKKVNNNILRGFWKHFWSAEQLAALERRVNGDVKRALRKRANAPYMVRVHGLSGPNLKASGERYLDHMANLQAALSDIGYDNFICYGTLLGAVRERDFIDHDDDVDMAVVLKTAEAKVEMAQIAQALRERGFVGTIFRSPPLISVRTGRKKLPIDLFPVLPGPAGKVQMYMEQMRVRSVPADVVIPSSPIEFLGRRFNAPASPTGFLAERYGPDWRTPVRKVAHSMIPA